MTNFSKYPQLSYVTVSCNHYESSLDWHFLADYLAGHQVHKCWEAVTIILIPPETGPGGIKNVSCWNKCEWATFFETPHKTLYLITSRMTNDILF